MHISHSLSLFQSGLTSFSRLLQILQLPNLSAKAYVHVLCNSTWSLKLHPFLDHYWYYILDIHCTHMYTVSGRFTRKLQLIPRQIRYIKQKLDEDIILSLLAKGVSVICSHTILRKTRYGWRTVFLQVCRALAVKSSPNNAWCCKRRW